MALKTPGKLILGAVVAAGVFFAAKWFVNRPKEVGQAKTVGKITIPDAPESSLSGTAAVKLEFPSQSPISGGVAIKWNEMAWNSQTSINYANGGANTTSGSLVEKAGANIQIVRQDDCLQSATEMIAYIKDYHEGKTKDGFFFTVMGTGALGIYRAISKSVESLGPEYQPVIFLTTGKSYGEDQIIGAEKYLRNKQLLKGAICHGVRLDGDIDVIIKFCSDNKIPINPDEKLYYYDALNLSYAKTYLSAVDDYNTNLKQRRKIVRNGRTEGDTLVGIDLVATWTPGDVNAVEVRGGVTIISTRIYASMMPNVTIACKKFLNDNRSVIDNLIGAFAQAGDQIRSFDDVKRYACGLNATIWAEKDPEYWYKYYNGVARDENTFLGGSMVYNLADMAYLFGLQGGVDIYKEVYNTFGKKQHELYPGEDGLPDFVEYNKAVDKSFMASVVANHPELLEGKVLKTDYDSKGFTKQVASKDVQILFATNSSTVLPESFDDLDGIYSSVVTSDGLKVAINGYTDDVGDPSANQLLSERRANAVKEYLVKKGIPSNRLDVQGFGEASPVAPNTTEAGRKQNRRVQIVLLAK